MRKFTNAEKVEVISPEGQKAIKQELEKIGKTSASQLTDAERLQVDLDKR